MPGYYEYYYAFKTLPSGALVFIANCNEQEGGEITKNFFIRPYDPNFFKKNTATNMFPSDDMYNN